MSLSFLAKVKTKIPSTVKPTKNAGPMDGKDNVLADNS